MITKGDPRKENEMKELKGGLIKGGVGEGEKRIRFKGLHNNQINN